MSRDVRGMDAPGRTCQIPRQRVHTRAEEGSSMADGTLRVGVIGTGGMGGRHARNLAHRVAGAEVAAVMDVDQARANALAGECGGADRLRLRTRAHR